MIFGLSKIFRLVCCVFLVCFFVHRSVSLALAETKFSAWGDIDVSFSLTDGADFTGNSARDNFAPRQRVRLWLKAQTSESLSALIMFRMATGRWGMNTAGGKPIGYGLGGDEVNLRTRFMFLNWTPVDSPWSARVGIIPVSIPYASYHSGVLDSSAGGMDISYKINKFMTANVVWSRPFDEYGNDGEAPDNTAGANLYDEMDMFMFKLPVTLREPDLSITPWALYAAIGKDSGFWKNIGKGTGMSANGDAFWGGLALQMGVTDDLNLKYDVLYGSISTSHKAGDYNSRGWQTSAILDYKRSWGTPGLFGWYATGSNADKVKRDRQWGVVPTISVFDFGFGPTSFGFQDALGINEDRFISNHAGGRWGIGAQVGDISLMDNLTQTVRLAYYRGTNDKDIAKLSGTDLTFSKVGAYSDAVLMTKEDYAVEANLVFNWKIEDNISLFTNLGYINLHRGHVWKEDRNPPDAWQFATNLRYSF